MDLSAEFDRVIKEMAWDEVIENVKAMIDDMVGDTLNPTLLSPPSPLPAPALPAEMWFSIQPPSVDRENVGFFPDEAAPRSSGLNVQAAPIIPLETQSQLPVTQPAQVYSQRQFLPHQLPQQIVPGGAASTSAPTAQYHNMPVMRLPGKMSEKMVPIGIVNGEGVYNLPRVPPVPPAAPPVQGPRLPEIMIENQVPIGEMNGEVVYGPPGVRVAPPAAPPVQGPRLSETTMKKMVPIGEMNGIKVYGLPGVPLVPPAAPPVTTSKSRKRKPERPEDDGQPHVKKPPNAFMIFRKEQSANVAAELNSKYTVAVNTVLGQRWKSMSAEQKTKYYEEAERERLHHILHNPHWSCSENYGKKRKRARRQTPATAEASEPEVTQEAKRTCRTPVETTLMEASTSQVLPSSTLLIRPHCFTTLSPTSLLPEPECFSLDQLLPSWLL